MDQKRNHLKRGEREQEVLTILWSGENGMRGGERFLLGREENGHQAIEKIVHPADGEDPWKDSWIKGNLQTEEGSSPLKGGPSPLTEGESVPQRGGDHGHLREGENGHLKRETEMTKAVAKKGKAPIRSQR